MTQQTVANYRFSLGGIVLFVLSTILACQPRNALPTLQPGEVEVPFETVVLDEEGAVQLTQEPPLVVITDQAELAKLQTLVSDEAFQQAQQVNFAESSLLALFRVPGYGCSSLGITIERLTRKANTVTVYANDWRPLANHACAETSVAAYHIIQVRKADAQLVGLELNLQIRQMERGPNQ